MSQLSFIWSTRRLVNDGYVLEQVPGTSYSREFPDTSSRSSCLRRSPPPSRRNHHATPRRKLRNSRSPRHPPLEGISANANTDPS